MVVDFKSLKTEDLLQMKNDIDDELNTRKGKVLITLNYNQYKGSGKCWVAEIDANTKEKLGFVNSISVEKNSNYSGKKNFELQEGKNYMICQSGTKTRDERRYIKVVDGTIKDL